MRAFSLLSVAAAVLHAHAVPPAVKVAVKLPGIEGKMPTMYAGYIDGGDAPSGNGTQYYHYVMYEAEVDSKNAPTVFWYNGGPGASSLFGLFQELGPLYINADSEMTENYNKTHIPTPLPNPYGWSKNFNLFAIDSPAPVGYSYCTEHGPSGGGTSCGNWTDTAVFKANHQVVTTLMKKVYPELLKNPLFITGESYAGLYVPGLVNELLLDSQGLNLVGYAVGDGCMGYDLVCMTLDTPNFQYPNVFAGPYYDIEFFAGHGQVSNSLYRKIRSECPEADLRSGSLSKECDGYVKQMGVEIGGFFVYDLFDDCPSQTMANGLFKTRSNRRKLLSAVRTQQHDYACDGTSFLDYLQLSSVKEALGVADDVNFFNADNGEGFVYTMNVNDTRPFHAAAQKSGLRILIYEGDSDASGLSSYGLQDVYSDLWNGMGLKKSQSWTPWTTDGSTRMGGYVMSWNNSQVHHVSVRGSGHMVPLNKPVSAFAMINSFVSNKPFPAYNP